MSGDPMYDWSGANTGSNNMGQWHQQAPPPSQPASHANNMNYNNSVPGNNNNINSVIGGMPNNDPHQQPSMQSGQQIHSMPSRQPQHQTMQQPQQQQSSHQMPRNSSLYQPTMPGPTTSPSQLQMTQQQQQQNTQFQQQHQLQHPQQSQQHYSQYPPSEYWSPPMNNQQTPHGQPLALSQTTQRGFQQQQQQHHNLHKQSPTATPLSHQTARGQLPTSHTPDRSSIPLSSSSSMQQQAPTSFHNSKEMHRMTPDQQMIPTMSPHQHIQQHPGGHPGPMHMMQQNHSAAPSNNLSSASPGQVAAPIQMAPVQQQAQQPSSWHQHQPDLYYLQQNQSRSSFPGSVNPYVAYDGASGSNMPENIVGSPAQAASTRLMIKQESVINNNDRNLQATSDPGWPSTSESHFTQQQATQGSNDNYYGHNYDGSGYYPLHGQPNIDTNHHTQNNVSSNMYDNSNSYSGSQSQMSMQPQRDGMGYSMSYGHMPQVPNLPMQQQNQPMAQTSQVSMHYQQPQQSFMTRPPQQLPPHMTQQPQVPNSQMHVSVPLHAPQPHVTVPPQPAPPKKRTRAKRDPNRPPAQKKQSPKKVTNGQGTTVATRRKKAPKDSVDEQHKASGYALFFSERQKQIKSENLLNGHEMDFGEISKRVSAEWSSLSDDQKNHYNKIVMASKRKRNDMEASERAKKVQSGQLIFERETEQQTSC